jgi:ADP-ribose pyrophosphatase YjhB (NUDIX family)
MNSNFHPIQLKIIGKICSSDGISFSKLHPDPTIIERDQYNFHLKQLVKQKIIYKRNGLYRLTTGGKHLIEEIQPVSIHGEPYQMFNVASLIIVVRDGQDGLKVLYQKRKRQPMWNIKQIPGGRLLHSELAEAAASRRLKEETGLEATPNEFKLLAMIRVFRHSQTGTLYSDFFYHIYLCRNPRGTLINTSEFGENSWEPIDLAIEHEENPTTGKKALVKIYKGLLSGRLPAFFYSVEQNQILTY